MEGQEQIDVSDLTLIAFRFGQEWEKLRARPTMSCLEMIDFVQAATNAFTEAAEQTENCWEDHDWTDSVDSYVRRVVNHLQITYDKPMAPELLNMAKVSIANQ